jgi:hypothetical protein
MGRIIAMRLGAGVVNPIMKQPTVVGLEGRRFDIDTIAVCLALHGLDASRCMAAMSRRCIGNVSALHWP